MIPELIQEIDRFLLQVITNNFSSQYKVLTSIIICYNEKGLGQEAIIKTLNKYYSDNIEQLDIYQDEVLTEVISCIEGFCSPNKIINLDR